MAGADGRVRQFAPSGEAKGVFPDFGLNLERVAFSADGARVVTAAGYENPGAQHEPLNIPGCEGTYTAAANSHNFHFARLWSADGAIVARLQGHEDYVESAAFSPDSRWLVTASKDKSARIWDGRKGELAAIIPTEQRFRDIVFSPDGGRMSPKSRISM